MTPQPKGRLVWVPDEMKLLVCQDRDRPDIFTEPRKLTAADIDALVTDELVAAIARRLEDGPVDCLSIAEPEELERGIKAALRELLGVK